MRLLQWLMGAGGRKLLQQPHAAGGPCAGGCGCNCHCPDAPPPPWPVVAPPPMFAVTPPPPPPTMPPPPPTPAAGAPPMAPLPSLPEAGADMLPLLGPGPTPEPEAPPRPPDRWPPPPPPTPPGPIELKVGKIALAKDSLEHWQLVNITAGPGEDGTWQADVLDHVMIGRNVTNGTWPVRPPLTIARYPHVHTQFDFVRNTPLPPTVAPSPIPKVFLPGGEPDYYEKGQWLLAPEGLQVKTTPLPNGVTLPPKVFVLEGGDEYQAVKWMPATFGAPAPGPAPAPMLA